MLKGEKTDEFADKLAEKGCEVIKMKDSTAESFKNSHKQKKNQSFLTGEAAIPKDLPFFSERKKCWNQA